MKKLLYDKYSEEMAKNMTKKYSTSFSLAVRLLSPKIRKEIYNIYGFVRLADEIVDSFEGFPQKEMLDDFENEYRKALIHKISTNPIIHAFIGTQTKFNIHQDLVDAFLDSMRLDLTKRVYENKAEMDQYIYGSADVVGLMCLMIFVNGDQQKYNELKDSAKSLGSAFQKVNFLRDLSDDYETLDRKYFPNVDLLNFRQEDKDLIIKDIKHDFEKAYTGIVKLPIESRLGVITAYKYYSKLLLKIEKTPSKKLMEKRIRISDTMKFAILGSAYIKNQLKWY